MRLQNTVTIDAPADVVWQLTTDVVDWPSLTPTMSSVERLDEGPFRLGSSARIKQPGQSPAVWTVDRFHDGREFAWHTKRMGMTMTGGHIVEGTGNTCRNTLTLDITGRGAKVFGFLFGSLLRKSIATENAGFKAKAEEVYRRGPDA